MDWKMLLLGEEDYSLLYQLPLRCAVMFAVAVITLRIIGKRAVPQGVFEVLIIVIIGSAAGDPLIYEGVGLLPAVLSFTMVVLLYKLMNFIIGRSKKAERFIEGCHVKLITCGRFEINNFSDNELDRDSLFCDMRIMHVSQLGQIRAAYIEATGQISIIFAEDDDVRPGLPLYPELLMCPEKVPVQPGPHACVFCGNVQEVSGATKCSVCTREEWVVASQEKRIS